MLFPPLETSFLRSGQKELLGSLLECGLPDILLVDPAGSLPAPAMHGQVPPPSVPGSDVPSHPHSARFPALGTLWAALFVYWLTAFSQ